MSLAKREIPVQKNRVYDIEITDISHKGEGIGRYQGFTVFVPAGLPGDRVHARIISVKPNYARGLIEAISTPSEHRVDTACHASADCGGCQLQHFDYERQLAYKTQVVEQALQRIGGLQDIIVHPIIGMSGPWHYRNKAQFPVGQKGNHLTIGGYKMRSHEVVDVESCAIQHQLINRILQTVRTVANELDIKPYNEVNHSGVLRHVLVRVAPATRQLMVVLVTRVEQFPHKDRLVQSIAHSMDEVVSVMQNINDRRTNVILGAKTKKLWGQDYIIDILLNNQFKISPGSFYQINHRQTEKLYSIVLEYADLQGGDTVIDAYCGIGTITLTLARNAGKVYGIEVIDQAVADANFNAKLNNIENVEFITGKAEEVIPAMVKDGHKIDCLVVDPPRKGCDQALLQGIVDAQVPKLVYVSCNPSTLARDIKYLAERGYNVLEVQPVDMFPHTAHVECVVLMSFAYFGPRRM